MVADGVTEAFNLVLDYYFGVKIGVDKVSRSSRRATAGKSRQGLECEGMAAAYPRGHHQL